MSASREEAMVSKKAKGASGKSDIWKQIREWISFSLSTLAFVISALGFYINSLERTDDLRLFLKAQGSIVSTDDGDLTVFLGTGAFVNAGNQSENVQDMTLMALLGKHEQAPKNCDPGANDSINSTGELEPFVIKPGEEFLKELKSERLSYKMLDSMEDRDWLTVCIYFTILTPTELVSSQDIVVFSGRVIKKDDDLRFNDLKEFDRRTITLVKASSFH
jgi:hypothetical protein